MATNVTRQRKAQASAPDKGADDVAILDPDVTVQIDGQDITFREYGFLEGLRLRPVMEPIITDIAERCWDTDHLSLETVGDVLARHAEGAVAQLMATSAGKEPDWVRGLNDEDGNRALDAWWAANSDFFVRRVGDALADLAIRKGKARIAGTASDGPTSGPPSSPTGTMPDA